MKKTSFRFLILTTVGSLFSACAAPQFQGVPPSPNARLYAYCIAHGIIKGELIRGKITPQNIQNVISLDHSAQTATLQALKSQTIRTNRDADRAIADLIAVTQ